MDLQKLQTPPAPEAEAELKSFTFRNIPPSLHRAWKTYAAIMVVSMEEYALIAIQNAITDATAGTKKELG